MNVNQKELSQMLGISTRQIRNLKSEGMFETAPGGRGYKLENCIQEYINYKINAELGRRTSISKEEMQAEHEGVKIEISKLKLRTLRRELHEASDVEAFLSDMLIRFKGHLMSLPQKIALTVSGMDDMNEIITAIKDELLSVLDELSEYDPDEIDGLGHMDTVDMEEEEEHDEEESGFEE